MSSETHIPTTQKAWRVLNRGSPENVLQLQDIPVPQVEPGRVLVKVHFAALNPAGYKLMLLGPNFIVGRPRTAEVDFSGVIVDANGTEFKEGDEVFGMFPLSRADRQGSLCQFATISTEFIARKPTPMSIEEASGLALAGMTAFQGLYDVANMERGQNIFINGGSTAIGIFAIQMAKASGCRVTASCSTKNVDFLRKLGADEVVDYTQHVPLESYFASFPPSPKYHVILDCAGEPISLVTHCEDYLAPDGVYVHAGGPQLGPVLGFVRDVLTLMRPRILGGVNRKLKMFTMNPDKKKLEAVAKLANEGGVRAYVDSVHEFSDVMGAYKKIVSKRACGKIVVRIPE